MIDIRQGKPYANYIAQTGWKVEKIGKVHVYVKSIPFGLSAIKVQRPEIITLHQLKKISRLSKKHKAFQVTIEPKDIKQKSLVTGHSYKQSRSPFLPTKTLHLDLTKSKEKLYQKLKKDTKYSLKKAENLRIYSIDQTYKFYKSWKNAVGFNRYVTPVKHLNALSDAFANNCLFLITPCANSGAIFLNSGDVAYYWQAFTSKDGRKKLAQYKILWSGILWAKKIGAKTFDFEGIYDNRFPNKSWLGFSHFKKSFGGKEVTYPGAFIKKRLPYRTT